MPFNHDSILDKEYWEGKPDEELTPTARAAKWFLHVVRRLFLFLDFVRPLFLSKTSEPSQPVRRTAYLDGLRGFAALLVYWQHHELWAHDGPGETKIFENAFGYEKKYHFVTLPGIRTFFTGGHFAVTVFFVISGYVLSAKPIALIQSGEHMKLADSLASALFRRWLRLYIPIICTTFVYMTIWHAFGIWTEHPPHQPTYREELWSWYKELKNFTFIFRTGGEPWFNYNHHAWSIPVEFKGSIIIYTSQLAFSRLTRNARLWCEVGLIFYFMWIVDGYYGSMFMAGMLLCDLDSLAANDDLPEIFQRLQPYKTAIYYHLFVISIYLGGVPSHDLNVEVLQKSRGWYYLSLLKPQAAYDYKWFYLFWASTFLVASIPHIPWLKRFFESPMNQYLGKISFALYLVHGPVLWILGTRVYAATGWLREAHHKAIPQLVNKFLLPKTGPLGLEFGFLMTHLLLLPVTLWLAGLLTRTLDEPSVRLTQWLYKRLLAPSIKL